MRILYGVAGDGMGHAIRSSVVIEHLDSAHRVDIVAYGRAFDFFSARRSRVHRISGMAWVYGGDRVERAQSVRRGVARALGGTWRNLRRIAELARRRPYDVVISDFEPSSHLYGLLTRTPVITLDNIQALRLVPKRETRIDVDLAAAKAFVRLVTPRAHHRVVTSFFQPQLSDPRTTVVPPILRPAVVRARPRTGKHVLVYQTAGGNDLLVHALKASGKPCRCYGLRPGITRPIAEENVTYLPFSDSGFIEDLRTASAVVTNGGFTLMTEALHLGKPVLSFPLRHQAEQDLNARHLAHLGYGMRASSFCVDALTRFFRRLEQYRASLSRYDRTGNGWAFTVLQRILTGIEHQRLRAGERYCSPGSSSAALAWIQAQT